MNDAWRLLSEFRPAAEAGEWQAIRWVRNTLGELGVADRVVEQLTLHLAETALATCKRCAHTPLSAACQVFVPAHADALRRGQQDWAYFLVTRPARLSDLDNAAGQAAIQVFLYPAAGG